MKKNQLLVFVAAFIVLNINAQTTNWGVQFSDAIISRYQPTINNMTFKDWEYSNSIVLHGMERIYEETKSASYLNYIKAYVDLFIGSDGTNVSAQLEQNLDVFHPGLLCLFLYKETGETKYKTAAELIRTYMNSYPRTASRGFWHKSNYPNQMWLDGIYMAEPFLSKYGFRMNDAVYCNNEATFQTLLLNSHAFDNTKNLLYHGWDESKLAAWANPATGVSPEIWSRAMGWYAMALVDILKYLPDDHPMMDSMVHVLNRVAWGIKNTQHATNGLWYQVMDKSTTAGNWTETSGSGMFVYALKTAVNYGWIDTGYLAVARKGWAGLQAKITLHTDNKPKINDFAAAMGIKATYDAYVVPNLSVDCPVTSGTQHPHGYCAILMASSVMEYPATKQYRLQVYSGGNGIARAKTDELYQDEGSQVTLIAQPAAGYKFSHWSGDITGANDTIEVKMNSHKHVTANFSPLTAINTRDKDQSKDMLICYKTEDKETFHAVFNAFTKSKVEINIYNINGSRVFTQKDLQAYQGRNEYLLRLNNIRSGIYVCSVTYNNGILSQKIFKI